MIMYSSIELLPKYLFLFKDKSPGQGNARLKDWVSYACFPNCARGMVSLKDVLKVAEKYRAQGYEMVLDQTPTEEFLPLYVRERNKLLGRNLKKGLTGRRHVKHPGRAYLENLLQTPSRSTRH